MKDTVFDAGSALIVGAGLAGLFAALKLAPRPVTVITPDPLGFGASSAWAQGGVAAAVGGDDTPEDHATDTLAAGAGVVDPEIARIVTEDAAARIDDLAKLGAPFDRDAFGEYALSREAAHGRARVVRVAGDGAGRAIMQALIDAVANTPSITVCAGLIAVDFAIHDNKVAGVFARRAGDRYSEPLYFRAPATILAAGGLGGLYKMTTNPSRVRGQAMGMAARAGAVIADPEFVQFHPTAFAVDRDPNPLATEALRGEGAVLLDEHGKRFMLDEHPDAELAPRDVVARAVFRHSLAGGAFLDTREALGPRLAEEFPTVAGYCHDAGIDPLTDLIPVAPAAHYHMGGVAVDKAGRTSLQGLWACGEVSSTGLHGANRLASNGLLEAVVFAARVARDVMKSSGAKGTGAPPAPAQLCAHAWSAEDDLRRLNAVDHLRQIMSRDVGVERSAEGLNRALREIGELELSGHGVSRSFLNMTTAATMVAAAALLREESRGGHLRKDFPDPVDAWARRTFLTYPEALAVRARAMETA